MEMVKDDGVFWAGDAFLGGDPLDFADAPGLSLARRWLYSEHLTGADRDPAVHGNSDQIADRSKNAGMGDDQDR